MNGKELLAGMTHIRENYITEAEESLQHHSGRGLGKYLLIAAIVSLLGFSAFAIDSFPEHADWYESFFSAPTHQEAQEQLSHSQMEMLQESLVPIDQSATVDGYTLTLESGLCDGYRMLLKFTLTAPEGVVLNGREYELDTEIRRLDEDDVPDSYGTGILGTELLEDGDPADNQATLLLDQQILPGVSNDYSLTDGGTCLVRFSNIREIHGYLEEYESTVLCEGNWEFRFKFRDDLLVTKSVEALDKPIRCESHMWIDNFLFRNQEIPLKTKVNSIEIRALTAIVNFSRPLIARHSGVTLDDPVYLVMEDGSRIAAKESMTAYRYDETDDTLYIFAQPVSIQDVAWMEFPGGVKVRVSHNGEG